MKTLAAVVFSEVIGLVLLAVAPAEAAIQLQFDYTYDSSGFFAASSTARSTLEAAGDFYASILKDDLLEINSFGSNHFTGITFRPDTGAQLILNNLDIPADMARVYVGSYDLGGNILGQAGPGGYSVVSPSETWRTNAITRGEGASIADVEDSLATEFAPWGGAMSIDSDTAWNLDYTQSTAWNKIDLYSVIIHELGHVLGIGIADSWDNLIIGNYFYGDAAVTEHGGAAPVTGDGGHWESGTTSTIFTADGSQEASMTPSISWGKRKVFTALDVAGLDDIGWDITAYGDANLDGVIDDVDATIMATNWLRVGATWSQGDFNSDGTVNEKDATLMAANWLSGSGITTAGVSEPGCGLLLSIFAAIFPIFVLQGRISTRKISLF